MRSIAFALVSLLAISSSLACTIWPTDMRQLDRDSDVIAIGVVEILREEIENAGQRDQVVTGVARLDVRHYERNREQRGRWIQFPYVHQWIDVCGLDYGFRPEPGQLVKIWFGRRGNGFEVLLFEPVELEAPEEPEEDDS